MEVGIVNYGLGNLGSLQNILKYLGKKPVLIQDPHEIVNFARVIVPGVGHFGTGMNLLVSSGFDTAIRNYVQIEGSKLLGICLGMQILLEYSEEGNTSGLGLITGKVSKFISKHTSTNMGWREVKLYKESFFYDCYNGNGRFYFIHSYHISDDMVFTTGVSHFGNDFCALYEKDNIIGAQFHPEKSHSYGKIFFQKFCS